MAENKPDHDLEQPPVRHEESDVNTWAVGKFAIALVIVCGLALLILVGLFKYFQAREAANQTPPAEGMGFDIRRLPPYPRLEETPVQDLKKFRAAEDQVLNSYGWVDQGKGVVRIPIERAIDLLAQRGLPARTEPVPSSGMSEPTESGLGDKMLPPGGPLAGELK